ncbi:TPA: DUF551 domain-containing protein [Serratia fonticola]
MKELDDFTVERLQQIAVFAPSQAEAAALARIALAAKTAGDGWIPCSERMPEIDEDVLTYTSNWGEYRVLAWDGGDHFCDSECFSTRAKGITHWQPLPPPPTTEK